MKAQLILENGKRFSGNLFGDLNNVSGKIVFSTDMIGYQEVLTDSGYSGEIVVMTFPLIGNCGINKEDIEGKKVTPSAIVVREKCDFPSNFRMDITLEEFLCEQGVVGLEGVDTRALTKQLRDKKSMMGVIMKGEPSDEEVKEYFNTQKA